MDALNATIGMVKLDNAERNVFVRYDFHASESEAFLQCVSHCAWHRWFIVWVTSARPAINFFLCHSRPHTHVIALPHSRSVYPYEAMAHHCGACHLILC